MSRNPLPTTNLIVRLLVTIPVLDTYPRESAHKGIGADSICVAVEKLCSGPISIAMGEECYRACMSKTINPKTAKAKLRRHTRNTWLVPVFMLIGFAAPRMLRGQQAHAAVERSPQESTQESKPKLSPVDYQPSGYVNDFASLTDSKTRAELESLCKAIDKKQHVQIAVVSVTSLGGSSLESFSLELANRWGVGHKEDNRGVLVLLVRDDHKWRIEVGIGLEPVLTNEKANKIGLEMVPMLQKGQYGNALLQTVRSIDRVLCDSNKQESPP
jgi:hypothetical protein